MIPVNHLGHIEGYNLSLLHDFFASLPVMFSSDVDETRGDLEYYVLNDSISFLVGYCLGVKFWPFSNYVIAAMNLQMSLNRTCVHKLNNA